MKLRWWHLAMFSMAITLIVVMLLPTAKEQGVLLARSDKVEEAAVKLQAVIAENPDNIKVIEELAEGYVRVGKSEKAIELYENYLKNNAADQRITLKLAQDYIARFEYDKAFKLLQGNSSQYLKELVDIAVKMGDLESAVLYSKKLLANLGDSDKAGKIELLKEIEKYEQWQLNYAGVAEVRESIAATEESLENNLEALEYFVWKKKKDKIKLYADKVEEYDQLSLDILRKLRSIWISLKDVKQAIRAAERAAITVDAELQDWLDYVMILGWSGQNDRALAVLDKMREKFPSEQEVYLQALAFAAKINNPLKRAEILEEYYRLNKDIELLREAGQLYVSIGEDEKALAVYEEIISSAGNSGLANLGIEDSFVLGELYKKSGRDGADKIIDSAYKKLLAEDLSGIEDNDFWVALDYAQKGGNIGLQAELLKSFYRLTNDEQMLRDARDLFLELQNWRAALDLDEILLSKGSLSEFERYGMVKLYKIFGENEKAQGLIDRLYADIVERDDIKHEDDVYWMALDYATENKDDLIRAEILKKFYAVSGDYGLLREAATLYKDLGMDEKAVEIYEILSRAGELDNFDKSELLRLYAKLGRDNELENLAVKFYSAAIKSKKLDKEEDLFYSLIEYLPKFGMGRERIRLIRKYADSGDIEAKILLAEYYSDSDKIAEARAELEGIVADMNADPELREQARLQLAYLIVREFYAAEEPEQQQQLLESGKGVIAEVIINLEKELSNLTGGELLEQQEIIDGFRVVLIRGELLRGDFAGVDKLLAKLYKPNSAIYLELASAYYDAEKDIPARKYLALVVDKSEFDIGQLAQLGFLYLSFKEYDKSLAAYSEADSRAQGLNKTVRLGLAELYGATGKKDEQYRIVDFYTSFGKTTVDDWSAAANARAQHGDSKGEFELLARAVIAHSDSALLVSRYISRLVGYGDMKEAVAYARRLKGLKVHKDLDELLTVGYALLDVGQVREAGRMFLVARTVESKSAEVKLALARYYTAVYLYPQAQKAYMQYLKSERDDARAWYELAVLKRAAGFKGGRYAFIKAQNILDSEEKNATDFSLASSIAFYLDKRDDALRYGRYATVLAPESPEYALDLAELYNSFGYPKYAMKTMESVQGGGGVAVRKDALIAQAQVLSRRFKDSIKSLKKVLLHREDDSAAQEALGYSKLELGEWIDAADSLALAEIKSNKEEAKEVAMYDQRSIIKELNNVSLPDFEE